MRVFDCRFQVDMKETLGRISDSQKSTRLCITVLGGSNVGKTGEFLRLPAHMESRLTISLVIC